MTHKEFFNILIGNPPPEVELEIEIKCREVKDLPDLIIKDYCCDLELNQLYGQAVFE